MLEEIKSAVNYLQKITSTKPTIGIILGTGLGNLANKIEVEQKIAYSEIPNFPQSTVKGHSGNLIFGKLSGKNVVALQGRFHYYEGYNMQTVTFPIRVFSMLGVSKFILSNAAGGVNLNFKVGDIMVISDHINLFPDNPLRGKNYDEFGPRFPDMSEPYSKNLIKIAHQIGKELNLNLQQGVYAGTSGPTFETPAEYKYMKNIGADAVGMSTVPEVIVAKHMGKECFALSVITDLGGGPEVEEVSHDMVLDVAKEVEPKVTLLVSELLKRM